jgi:hypothetical protein
MSDDSDQWWADYATNPASRHRWALADRWQRWSRTSDGRALKNAAKAEKKIERELAWLGDEWHVLHVVDRVGHEGDIDYVLVGPAGVFTLTVRRPRSSAVLVVDSRVLVDGHPRNYVRDAQRGSEGVERTLAEACRQTVRVRPVVVVVDVDDFTVQRMPTGLHVTTCRRLLPWLKSLPDAIDSETVDLIHQTGFSVSHQVVAS